MTLADAITAYLAAGASLSAFALFRMLRSRPSMSYLRQETRRTGLPLSVAALLAASALLFVLAEYALLWPVRWREALR